MEETYEVPEVVTYGELDLEPVNVQGVCTSMFACDLSTFALPG